MTGLKHFLSERKTPDQLTIFAILYMVPIVHELGDPWWTWGGRQPPLLLQGAILAVALFIALNISIGSFLFFLAISTIYYLLTSFPEIPNHMTLVVFCNLAMLICLPALLSRSRDIANEDVIFASLKPVLRLILITLFFIAGFHKLNADFLDPGVSCVNFVVGLLEGRLLRNVYGIPFLVYLSPLLVYVVIWVTKKISTSKIDFRDYAWWTVASLVLILVAGAFLAGGGAGATIIAAGAVLVLIWQLIEGPLLFVRALQAPILLISLVLLGTIAISGVPMFPAVLLPLLFVFVPDHVFAEWREQATIKLGDSEIHSIYLCFLLNVVGASLVYVNANLNPSYEQRITVLAVSQFLFLVSVVLLLFPLIDQLVSSKRTWKWTGVPVWNDSTPRLFLLFPLLLFIWGMTPYLGLRTTGNFSMFSNVKTEGPTSNHLLLGSNPLKIWGYQEDRVNILDVDEDVAKAGHHYDPLGGNSLPVVEFRKLVTIWRDAGRKVPMKYEYHSGPVRTQDITMDNAWADTERNWESFWLDFRPVQAQGPNQCRW